MSSYVELASWMAQRLNGQDTLPGKWRKFIQSTPPVGPWYRPIYFDGFRAGVGSIIDILSKLEWQDPPILDLQLGELRDELQQLAEDETQKVRARND
jgi:hypothetical protein